MMRRDGSKSVAFGPPAMHVDQRPPSQLLAEELQLNRLEQAGEAGQDAGPHGMGPAPVLQHAPGGDLLAGLQHPSFTTVEQFYRVGPEDSWFSPNLRPDKPVKFELGSFTVPDGMTFLVTDYVFSVLRQSGADPFDFVVAAPYRYSGYLGFDITVNRTRMSTLFYQLDPAPAQLFRQSFVAPGSRVNQAQFNSARANRFGSTAGEGTSLLPPRPNVQGPRNMPFTMVAGPGSSVSLTCVIFRRVMTPLAGVQGSVSGYTVPSTVMSSLFNRVRPR